jgi:hypothetical protein
VGEREILIKLSKLRNKAAKASTVSSSFSFIKVGKLSNERKHYHSSSLDHIKTGHEWERNPVELPGTSRWSTYQSAMNPTFSQVIFID